MGEVSSIAWTDATFNPWWGCTKVSEGCAHCYAETFERRYGPSHWGPGVPRRFFGDKHWNEPEKWNREAARLGVRTRVFCGSMCDVFDPEVDESWRMRLWGLIARTPNLDWLLLTKRPAFALSRVPAGSLKIAPHVWLGTTVEGPDTVRRVEALHRLRGSFGAAVSFVSAEPLVAPWLADLTGIDWLIVGGESGPKARPMDIEWARALRDCANASRTAFFMKQLGGKQNKRDRLDDFPVDLQIREFPEVLP